jgi:hypothetical protein
LVLPNAINIATAVNPVSTRAAIDSFIDQTPQGVGAQETRFVSPPIWRSAKKNENAFPLPLDPAHQMLVRGR